MLREVMDLLNCKNDSTQENIFLWKLGMAIVTLILLTFLWMSVSVATDKPLWHLLLIDKQDILQKTVLLFAIAVVIVYLYLVSLRTCVVEQNDLD